MGVRALVALSLVVLATSCGGRAGSSTAPGTPGGIALAQARDKARHNDVDGADAAYLDAYGRTKDFTVLQERVEFLVRAGRAGKGVEAAKLYYDKHVREQRAVMLYCDALLGAERGSEALEIAETVRQMLGEAPGGYERVGRALVLVDRSDEGLEALHKAVQLGNEPRYHRSLGLALHKLGKDDEAALEFRAVVKAAPKDAEAHALLAMALRGQLEYAEARTTLEQALTLDERSGRAYFELGLLHDTQKELDQGEQALSRAVELAPNESMFWYGFGEHQRVTGRLDGAVSAYKKALALDPPYARAFQKLGIILDDRGAHDEAEPLLAEAIKREPRLPLAWVRLGAIYARKKDTEKALAHYTRFLELAPKNDPDRARATAAVRQLSKTPAPKKPAPKKPAPKKR